MERSQHIPDKCFPKAGSNVHIGQNSAKYRYELPNHRRVVNHQSHRHCTKFSREKGMVHECIAGFWRDQGIEQSTVLT